MGGKAVTHSEAWWSSEHRPAHVLRCTARLKHNGAQCRREAHSGTNVCGQHGALAPAVQAKAATRIAMSVDDAVKRLLEMIDDPTTPHAVKAKVLHDLLDRGGLGATQKHLVGIGQIDPVEALFRDLLADPRSLMDPNGSPPPLAAEYVRLNAEALSDDYILDAVVVEDDLVPARQPGSLRAIEAAPEPKRKTPKHIREALERLL